MTPTTSDHLPVTDLMDVDLIQDPFPRFAELRRDAPISLAKSPLVRGNAYLVTRYDDVMTMHIDRRFSNDMQRHAGGLLRVAPKTFRLLTTSMVFKDDPEHKRLRSLVSKAFTPRRIQEMDETVGRMVDELVERLKRGPEQVELMESFAIQLPLSVIADMLGVSDADRKAFHEDVKVMTEGFGGGGVMTLLRALPTTRRLMRLFNRLADGGSDASREDLISALLAAEEDGDRLAHDEILAMIFLLLLAGHDTTANLIGNSVLALIDHPEQLARLREDPSLIDSAVEELLRFTSPVPVGTTRYVLEDVELGGVLIPEGSQVLGMVLSANRDEAIFDRPETLDLGRDPNRHIAFAFGAHYCLSNQLARLEARRALLALVQAFDRIELAVPRESIKIKRNPALRGPLALPVRLA